MAYRMVSDSEWDTIQKKLSILAALEDAGVDEWERYPKWLQDDDYPKKEPPGLDIDD